MSQQPSVAPARLIDADFAGAWGKSLGACWLSVNPLAHFDPDWPLDRTREAIVRTVRRTVGVMVDFGPQVAADAAPDPRSVCEWLYACCDAAGEPSVPTERNRVFAPFGDRVVSAEDQRPLRRWLALARMQFEQLGIPCLRGRPDVPLGYRLVDAAGFTRLPSRWMLIEDGWPRNEEEHLGLLLPAAAAAVYRSAVSSGRRSAPVATLHAAYLDDARAQCAKPDAQPPAWFLDPPAVP